MNKPYLIQPSRGLVIGIARFRETGWIFHPFSSAHGISRKPHTTKEAAALRYSGPSCRWIEAENTQAAHLMVNALKAAYDRNEPCSRCVNYDSQGGCMRGAAPTCVRNLGKCAKFFSEDEGQALVEHLICDPGEPMEGTLTCRKHPDVTLATSMSCCLKCEAEIDAAVMHTISEPR